MLLIILLNFKDCGLYPMATGVGNNWMKPLSNGPIETTCLNI